MAPVCHSLEGRCRLHPGAEAWQLRAGRRKAAPGDL